MLSTCTFCVECCCCCSCCCCCCYFCRLLPLLLLLLQLLLLLLRLLLLLLLLLLQRAQRSIPACCYAGECSSSKSTFQILCTLPIPSMDAQMEFMTDLARRLTVDLDINSNKPGSHPRVATQP